MATLISDLVSPLSLQAAFDQLKSVYSPSLGISWARAAADNIESFQPISYSNFRAHYLSGTLTNGDEFKRWGTNLTGYPNSTSELYYAFKSDGTSGNRVRIVGSLVDNGQPKGLVQSISDVSIWGDWGQISVADAAGDFSLDGKSSVTSFTLYSPLWGYGSGVSLTLAGDISTVTSIADGYYRTSISGTYTSVTLVLNELMSEKSRIELSGIAVDAAVNIDDPIQFLARALIGDDHVNGKAGNDWLSGYEGNDVLTGNGGDDWLDGGGGLDKALYSGTRAQYVIEIGETVRINDLVEGRDGQDNLTSVERAEFNDLSVAFDTNGVAGQAYRLYKAAFDREPDMPGLGFWIRNLDNGMPLLNVAGAFIASEEFGTSYGSTGDQDFIRLLYKNVLDRSPDQEGYKYWQDAMHAGLGRDGLLLNFSESQENKDNLAPFVSNGIEYVPFIS